MIKRLFLTLFLISGCSSSPVSIEGELLPDRPFRQLMDKDVITLRVWICPKKIGLAGEVTNSYYNAIAQAKIEEIAEEKCQKAIVAEDNRSYTAEIVPGRYEIAAVMKSVTPPALAVPSYRWWLMPTTIYKDKTIDLTLIESHSSDI